MRFLARCIFVLSVIPTVFQFFLPTNVMEEISGMMEDFPFLPAGNYHQKTSAVWNYFRKLFKKIKKNREKVSKKIYTRF